MSEVERFLAEVDEGCKRINADLRRCTVDELRAHLDASVQARMELGSTQSEAEEEAVRGFGSSKAVSRALADVHEAPKVHRGHLVCLTVMTAFFVLVHFCYLHRIFDSHAQYILQGWAYTIPIVAVAYAAAKSPRFPFRGLLLVAPVAVVWFTMVWASVFAADVDVARAMGTRFDQARSRAAEHRAWAEGHEQRYVQAQAIHARYLAGENIAPHPRDWYMRLETRRMASRKAAARAWRARPLQSFLESARHSREEAAGLEGLDRRFWWTGIPAHLPGVVTAMAGPWMAFMFVVTSLGWFLGAGFRSLRRAIRRKPSGGRFA